MAKRGLGLPLGPGGKIVQGELETNSDGTAKWTYINHLNPLTVGFGDRSTFTSTKNADGKWEWNPTTSTSVQNLSAATGIPATQITDSLYKTPATQTVLNGQRVNLLGGLTAAKKVDPTLPNTGGTTTNPNTPVNQTSASGETNTAELKKENDTVKEGTRRGEGSYGDDMKYPINLASEVQDVIKFSILEYVPSLQGAPGRERIVTLKGGSPIVAGSTRIGVITLPIPAGISDSNPVGWENDTLNVIQEAAAKTAKGYFEGGVDGAGKQLDIAGKQVQGGINTGEAKTAATGFLIGEALQKNIVQRAYGAINNNNVELLFSGPSLRQFSFTFLFYPREPNEAIMVRRIIRAFKQAMSVKRSATSLLLKSPHTFAISYMTVGQGQHPYLNRFKECALTSCNVEYTPDGTYMTYGNDGSEKSMTAYRLSLSFQELEPIFDDEYGSEDNIGF
jgi:hypothetical protein